MSNPHRIRRGASPALTPILLGVALAGGTRLVVVPAGAQSGPGGSSDTAVVSEATLR